MKNLQETSKSLEILATAIQTESQKKGKATLYSIAKQNKTFKVVEILERSAKISETNTLSWIAFSFTSDIIGKDITLEASVILFRKNLYDLEDETKIIPTTNKGALGTLALKHAFENDLEIKPKEIECKISILDENNKLIKVESKELIFEILDKPKDKPKNK
jgi:hypothetical protein